MGPSARLKEAGSRIPIAHQTITTLTELPEAVARDSGLLKRSLPRDKTDLYVAPKLRICGAVPQFPLESAASGTSVRRQHDTTVTASCTARRPLHRV